MLVHRVPAARDGHEAAATCSCCRRADLTPGATENCSMPRSVPRQASRLSRGPRSAGSVSHGEDTAAGLRQWRASAPRLRARRRVRRDCAADPDGSVAPTAHRPAPRSVAHARIGDSPRRTEQTLTLRTPRRRRTPAVPHVVPTATTRRSGDQRTGHPHRITFRAHGTMRRLAGEPTLVALEPLLSGWCLRERDTTRQPGCAGHLRRLSPIPDHERSRRSWRSMSRVPASWLLKMRRAISSRSAMSGSRTA